MKKTLKFLVAGILLTTALFTSIDNSFASQSTGKLVVQINGLKSSKGLVRIAIFNSKKAFSDKKYKVGGAVKLDSLKIVDKKCSWTVDNLPFGTYAVRTFHDLDGLGKFKVSRFGIPQYDYGFSNDAKGLFGPPSFEKCQFTFDKSKTISITMHR